MSKKQTVEIENAGPITHVTVPIPADGGVVELTGPSGVGKTIALRAIQSAVTQKGKIPIHDGQPEAEVNGFGILARFSRRTTFSGELEVELLDDERFSIADLIDPGFKDPEARDAKRIKALVQLVTGEETADPAIFHKLLEGGEAELDKYVSLKALGSTDVVTMASRIKRDLEKAARASLDLAEKARLRSASTRAAIKDIDLTQPHLESVLDEYHLATVKNLAKLETEFANAEAIKIRAASSRLALKDKDDVAYKLEKADEHIEELKSEVQVIDDEISVLELQLAEAKGNRLKKLSQLDGAAVEWASLTREAEVVKLWKADIEAAEKIESPTEEQLQQARDAVAKAKQQMDQGMLIRNALTQLEKADVDRESAKELEVEASKLKSAAQGTDAVLSEIVGRLNLPLKIKRGRLTTKTKRGDEVFDDLSDGQQVKLVMDIVTKALGPTGMAVLPQRFWQDLSPSSQRMVAQGVKGKGTVIVTARVTDGEGITAQEVDPEPPALSLD